MVGTPRVRLLAALLFALLVHGLTAREARAEAFALNDASWEGCTDLLDLARQELGPERVVIRSVLDWEQVQAGDGVLVLHPTKALDAEEAAAFMKAGGRLAIIDDFGHGDQLLEHFKIRRRGLPTHPLAFLRGRPALAIATPAFDSADGQILGLHPTVADVKQVVLNHGTGLEHPDLTPVLEVRSSGADPVTTAVAGQIDGPVAKGRLFAMGDPSAFINLMLRYPGNRAFAAGVVHYLSDGDAVQTRHGRLFIIANEFGERGSFGGVTPLRKTLDRKLRALLEALQELRDQGFPWWLHITLAALAALAVLWWTSRSLMKLYKSRLPRFARHTPLVAQGGLAGRAAVLGAAVSPPALALLEMRSALGEALAAHLRRTRQTPLVELVAELQSRHHVPPALEQRAREVVRGMQDAESKMLKGRSGRVTTQEVTRAAAVIDELLDTAGVEGGRIQASRPPRRHA